MENVEEICPSVRAVWSRPCGCGIVFISICPLRNARRLCISIKWGSHDCQSPYFLPRKM